VEDLLRLPRLNTLILDGTTITDGGTPLLRKMTSLGMLSLNSTYITDRGLKDLETLRGLYRLDLNDTKVSEEGVKNFQRSQPKCNIEYAAPLASSLQYVIQELKEAGANVNVINQGHHYVIESVEFPNHLQGILGIHNRAEKAKVFESCLIRISEMKDLKRLTMHWAEFDNTKLEYIKNLTYLSELDLSGSRITDQGIKDLKGLVNLQKLKLEHTQITDAGVAQLAQLHLNRLYSLDLDHSKTTVACLESLKDMQRLRSLSLQHLELSTADLEKFKQVLPTCQIKSKEAQQPVP
tara:strand:- start:32958 stop:33839 length:882 start_codon:yes stop_codon:yes gene_type:complete